MCGHSMPMPMGKFLIYIYIYSFIKILIGTLSTLRISKLVGWWTSIKKKSNDNLRKVISMKDLS